MSDRARASGLLPAGLSILALVTFAACSASESASNAGTETLAVCGIPEAECANCELCVYSHSAVTESRSDLTAMHLGANIDVAHASGRELSASRLLQDGTWATGLISSAAEPETISIAVDDASDTRWVAMRNRDNEVSVFQDSAGGWSAESISIIAFWLDLDVDPSGSPVVAIHGVHEGTAGVFVATRESVGRWSIDTVAESMQGRVAVRAADTVHLAWNSIATQGVHYAQKTSSGYDTLAVATDLGTPPLASIDLDVAVNGTAHLVYSRGFGDTVHARIQEGVPSFTEVHSGFDGGETEVALDAQSAPHVVFRYRDAVAVADFTGKAFSKQPIVNRGCSSLDLQSTSIGIDSTGQLRILTSCTRTTLATRTEERYPDDYWDKCVAVATSLCARACSCGDCCIEHPGGNSCTRPENSCRSFAAVDLCGDASLLAATIDACVPAADTATCGDDGLLLPEACEANFSG